MAGVISLQKYCEMCNSLNEHKHSVHSHLQIGHEQRAPCVVHKGASFIVTLNFCLFLNLAMSIRDAEGTTTIGEGGIIKLGGKEAYRGAYNKYFQQNKMGAKKKKAEANGAE